MAKFNTMAALFEVDERSPMSVDDFNDTLWTLLCDIVTAHDNLNTFPAPVRLYYTGRYIQWQIGNGGFAQAAYNCPELFVHAVEAYTAIGKTKMAQLLSQAIKLLPQEQSELEQKGLFSATIGDVFAHFKESRMSALDRKLHSVEWEVDEAWAAFARQHRDAFQSTRSDG